VSEQEVERTLFAELAKVRNKEVLYLHRGAQALKFGPFGADVLL
jgi:hypothetical protein